jgi:hypothetical protein
MRMPFGGTSPPDERQKHPKKGGGKKEKEGSYSVQYTVKLV